MQEPSTNANRLSLNLPAEVLVEVFSILSYSNDQQPTLRSCTLVSRLWYMTAVEALYRSPDITGKNFQSLVNSICPSINAHVRKSELSRMVRRLDMSKLVHDSSKSLTARILGRCKDGLEEFIAPQASFAVNCLAALSKCTNLRSLDLSRISEALDLSAFFIAVSKLEKLRRLYYPRSSKHGKPIAQPPALWPSNLHELHVSGDISPESFTFFSNFPPSLTNLSLADGHPLTIYSISSLLEKIGYQLYSLKMGHPNRVLGRVDLWDILRHTPVLRRLSITPDYFFPGSFIVDDLMESGDTSPLVELQLNPGSDPLNLKFRETVSDRLLAAVVDGRLGRLRRVKVHRQLVDEQNCTNVKDLDDMLEALAREDAEALHSDVKADAGVWIFGR